MPQEMALRYGGYFFQAEKAAGADPVGLVPGDTLITYQDENQLVDVVHISKLDSAANGASWQHVWKTGSGNALDAGEVVQFKICIDDGCRTTGGLATALGVNTKFTINITPAEGGDFPFTRTTPSEIKSILDLK